MQAELSRHLQASLVELVCSFLTNATLLISLLFHTSVYTLETDHWQSRTLPNKIKTAVVANEKLYFINGRKQLCSYKLGLFSKEARTPPGIKLLAVAGRLFALGTALWRFEPRCKGKWECIISSLPHNDILQSVACKKNIFLLLRSSELLCLNTELGTQEIVAQCPLTATHIALCACRNSLYFFGWGVAKPFCAVVWRYNGSNTWTRLPDSPACWSWQGNHHAVVVGDLIYISASTFVVAYNPRDETWQPLPSFPARPGSQHEFIAQLLVIDHDLLPFPGL